MAAYYELNKILKSKEDGISIKKVKQPHLTDVLNKLSKEELIHIITDITDNDIALRNNLLLMYSKIPGLGNVTLQDILFNAIIRNWLGVNSKVLMNMHYCYVCFYINKD